MERLSKSRYKDKLIIKGGLLLTSIFGDDERTTKDMDTTLKSLPLTKEKVEEIFNDIFSIDINDDVKFKIISIKDIRLEDEYAGFRLNIFSQMDTNKTYITVEVTSGDIITPREIKYNYNCIFEDKTIPIMSYTIETVISEKFQTIITRGLLNTRLKDFYDIYVLFKLKYNEIDKKILRKAVVNTFNKRNTKFDIEEFNEILKDLKDSKELQSLWLDYQKKNSYAKDIDFKDTLQEIDKLIKILENELIMTK